MHADRTNRVMLTIVGLLAVLIGAGGLLAAYGVFGSRFQHQRLLDNQFARYFSAHGNWLWPAIAGVAFVVMLLSLLWLLRLLFDTDRTGDIMIESSRTVADGQGRSRGRGRTILSSSALTEVVAAEIGAYHGVSGARARVIGDAAHPMLVIDVTVTRKADIPAVIGRIQREAVEHAQAALAPSDLQVKLDISVNDKGAARAL